MQHITIDTVDTSESTAGLSPPMVPTPNGRLTRKDMDKVTGGEPLAKLPRILIPSKAVMVKPPVMHYAWPVDFNLLMDYAEERGLTEYQRRAEESRDEDDEEDDEPKSRYSGISLTTTTSNALRKMAEDAGAQLPTDLLQVALGLHGRDKRRQSTVVAFYTNFDLNRTDLPSLGEIEKLRDALEMQNGGPPRWYLDASNFKWEPWIGRW